MILLPNHYYKPKQYFLLTIFITWGSLFAAAYCSHTEGLEPYITLCMLPSLLTPFGVALYMIYRSKNKELIADFKDRLFKLKNIKLKYWWAILLLMPSVVLMATAISLVFGKPVQQFFFSEEFAILNGSMFASIAILFLAPTFEELGWRGYGIDSLMPGKSLLKASFLFTFLWALWHLPLFFIKGYYHYEIFQMSPIFVINFFVALIPAVILSNWIYYKNSRSIIAIILFHFMLNLSSMIFQTEQFTKCIITILLLIISGIVIRKNSDFFLLRRTDSQHI
jgi:membrane protease YdiL (CAAX protease family)